MSLSILSFMYLKNLLYNINLKNQRAQKALLTYSLYKYLKVINFLLKI